jgi:hypothetical protein
MNFKDFYTVNENVNKFDIGWQVVRTDARDLKDVPEKISFVLQFLNSHPTKENYGRVHNWLRMTKLGYKSEPEKAQKFENALDQIENNKEKYSSEGSSEGDLSSISNEKLKKVYKDLKKRKYGFQIKTVPKAHTEFLNKLETELGKRRIEI